MPQRANAGIKYREVDIYLMERIDATPTLQYKQDGKGMRMDMRHVVQCFAVCETMPESNVFRVTPFQMLCRGIQVRHVEMVA